MPQVIHDWASYFPAGYTLEQHAITHPNGMLDRDPPRHGLHGEVKAVARVSGSCWIIDCPTGDGGAEFVNFDDPRFFCCTCRNQVWGGQPLPVVLPGERKALEAALLARPDPLTRNWLPAETVADLRAENAERGVN